MTDPLRRPPAGEMRSAPPPVPGPRRPLANQPDPDSLAAIPAVASLCGVAAVLAFVVSFLLATENAVAGMVGMGSSAVLFMLAMIALLLADLRSQVRLLTQRHRQRRIADDGNQPAEVDDGNQPTEVDADDMTWSGVDGDDLAWSVLDNGAAGQTVIPPPSVQQQHQRAGHLAEIRRGRRRRFWRAVFSVPVAVDDAIGGLVGRENKILRHFIRGICCLAALAVLVVFGVVLATIFPPGREATTSQQNESQEQADRVAMDRVMQIIDAEGFQVAMDGIGQLDDDEDREEHRRAAFAVPPYYWSCDETDYLDQWSDFCDWDSGKSIVPEVWQAVGEWLRTQDLEIDKVITNEPTGAQYRLSGKKGAAGAWCKIEFVGNLHWD